MLVPAFIGHGRGTCLSTHAIGSVRLLLGSLVLLFAGAGLYWLVGGPAAGASLVIRGGTLEVEPWNGTLRPEGADLYWDHAVSNLTLSVYRAEDRDQEYELGEPIQLTAVKSLRMDFRVDGVRLIQQAAVVTFEDRGVRISMKGGSLAQRGDIWVPPGFVQDGKKKPYEIAILEFLDQGGQVVARYQNPDLGRRFRFRIKLTGANGS